MGFTYSRARPLRAHEHTQHVPVCVWHTHPPPPPPPFTSAYATLRSAHIYERGEREKRCATAHARTHTHTCTIIRPYVDHDRRARARTRRVCVHAARSNPASLSRDRRSTSDNKFYMCNSSLSLWTCCVSLALLLGPSPYV